MQRQEEHEPRGAVNWAEEVYFHSPIHYLPGIEGPWFPERIKRPHLESGILARR